MEEIRFELPQSLEPIDVPAQVGPSVFPQNIDQLKTIDYSAVPNDSILEAKLSRYYELLSLVASNNASDNDLSELQRIMLDVRNYVLTEEDFNLMADAVRTTQIYLKNAAEANINNYKAVSDVSMALVDKLNDWTKSLSNKIDQLGKIPSLSMEATYSFGPNKPIDAPENYPLEYYYWCDTSEEPIVIKKAQVLENNKLGEFSVVNMTPSQQKELSVFTKASDIFKRKTVISMFRDPQAGQSTRGIGEEQNDLSDYTNESDLVLEELNIGYNSGQVGNVDDLIDGRFEVGLTPVDLVDSNLEEHQDIRYPEDEYLNSRGQGGD